MTNPPVPMTRASEGPRTAGVVAGWQHRPFAIVLLLLAVDAGCSRPPKPAEEVDWGQPKPTAARRPPLRELVAEPANGAGAVVAADEKPAAGSGGDGGAAGSDNRGGGEHEGEPGGAAPPAEAGGKAPGPGGGGPGGESDAPPPPERQRPAPALPGREPVKPALSAADAAASAKQLLKRAQQLLRADADAAAAAAIEAYDQVLPHAESDTECKKLCGQLEGVLTAVGRGQGRPQPVPTRFE
jgi:hypothetical protein